MQVFDLKHSDRAKNIPRHNNICYDLYLYFISILFKEGNICCE